MDSDVVRLAIVTTVGLALAVAVYRAARKQLLSFRFTIGWLTLCGIGLFAGLLMPALVPLGERMRLSPAGLLAAGGVFLLIIICVQLSISISVLQSRVRTLAEELARVHMRLKEQQDDADRG